MTNPSLFNTILVWPIVNVLVAIYQIFALAHVPYALGFAIIGLTVLIRLLLYPLMSSQLKASKKMQMVAPHISQLKEKHKNDAKKLQEETMKLYKEHGINPAAGCLPILIQFPIIIGLYSVLQQVVKAGHASIVTDINKIVYFPFLKLHAAWDQHFFGLPLGQAPNHLISTLGPLILLFPVVTAALQFVQSKMMIPSQPQAAIVKKGDGKKKDDDFAAAFQTQSLYIIPLVIGFTSYNFPIGLSLYWNTFTIFGIIQQYRIAGWGGLIEWKDVIFRKLR